MADTAAACSSSPGAAHRRQQPMHLLAKLKPLQIRSDTPPSKLFGSSKPNSQSAHNRGTSDWSAWSLLPTPMQQAGRTPLALYVSSLEPRQRKRFAAKWSEQGLAEHASVASFARHVLELMSHGAPSDLIQAAQAAAVDEITHARICFALASVYADGHVSCEPGALALQGSAQLATSVAELMNGVILHGCVEETLSALVCMQQLGRAEAVTRVDEEKRVPEAMLCALRTIAHDEARHATLAWRTARCALATEAPGVQEAARSAFRTACNQIRSEVTNLGLPWELALNGAVQALDHAHGILHPVEVMQIRQAAVEGLLLPWACRFLGLRLVDESAPIARSDKTDQLQQFLSYFQDSVGVGALLQGIQCSILQQM